MKKVFFIFVALVMTMSAFAQEMYLYKGVFYGVSEYGDLIYYSDGETNRNKIKDADVADCSCYQGYDPKLKKRNEDYGSCCWMEPNSQYPRCAYGCI
jgi:hypothetical protein